MAFNEYTRTGASELCRAAIWANPLCPVPNTSQCVVDSEPRLVSGVGCPGMFRNCCGYGGTVVVAVQGVGAFSGNFVVGGVEECGAHKGFLRLV